MELRKRSLGQLFGESSMKTWKAIAVLSFAGCATTHTQAQEWSFSNSFIAVSGVEFRSKTPYVLEVVENNLVLLHTKVDGISANSLGSIEIIDEMLILWRDASFSLVLNDRGIQVPASEATGEVLGFENAAYVYIDTSTYSGYAVRYHGINYVFSNREVSVNESFRPATLSQYSEHGGPQLYDWVKQIAIGTMTQSTVNQINFMNSVCYRKCYNSYVIDKLTGQIGTPHKLPYSVMRVNFGVMLELVVSR